MEVGWGQKQWERSIGIRQATMASGLARLGKMSALNRRLVRKMQDGTLGEQTAEPEDEETDNVHVGDVTIYQPPAPPAKSAGVLPTAALAAASLLGGAGLAAAVLTLFRPPAAPVAPTAQAATDTDTRYQLRLVDEDPPQ